MKSFTVFTIEFCMGIFLNFKKSFQYKLRTRLDTTENKRRNLKKSRLDLTQTAIRKFS
jgi:hypothetical protein